MKARPYFWSSLSPVKDLMAILAESYGISPALHNLNRDVLARVLSRMPSYYPKRGNVKNALMLWKDTLQKTLEVEIAYVDTQGAYPSNPNITDVLFVITQNGGCDAFQKGVHQNVKEEYLKNFIESSSGSRIRRGVHFCCFKKESSHISYPMGMRIEGGGIAVSITGRTSSSSIGQGRCPC